jgi:hypothetical protein
MGPGFALNHIEEAFDRLFGFSGVRTEYTEFDTSVLLRSAIKDRIDGLVRAVQGGIYSRTKLVVWKATTVCRSAMSQGSKRKWCLFGPQAIFPQPEQLQPLLLPQQSKTTIKPACT